MSRQHSRRHRRTDTESAARQEARVLTGHPGPRRVAGSGRSPLAILATSLFAPLAVASVVAPLTTLAALLALAAVATVARTVARRVAGRHASLAVPGTGLRLDVALAER
jgi:hypothetical protein